MMARENNAAVLQLASREREPKGVPAIDENLRHLFSASGVDEGQPPTCVRPRNKASQLLGGVRELPQFQQDLFRSRVVQFE
jgi:hypothetical protein